MDTVLVEPLGGDLVALAQCHALDASVFPHPSLPAVHTSVPAVLVARPGEPAERAEVIGFVATRRDGNLLEVIGLAVDREHRGQGVGRALVRAAIASARERRMRAITLHCSTGNHAALELYTTAGFRPAHRIRRFYDPRRFPDGGDAYVMVLRLD